ncbi:MAG: hypothetical protein LBD97_08065 [Bifidobacteriaceae bacterium]|jgi:hypothetical protein|nr:hypothetical protein [Bifidobacteriaceae bacterium]
MPRDVVIVTPQPLSAAHWRAAATAAARAKRDAPDEDWFSAHADGAVTTISSPALGAVLTAAPSRRVRVAHDLIRLVPEARAVAGAAWWTEAWAPWGPGGAVGVSIARILAASLGGVIQAAEGG